MRTPKSLTVGPRIKRDLAIAAFAMALAAIIVLPQVVGNNGDLTRLLRVGTDAPARAYVEQSFPNPTLTGDLGHDGQQFYVIAGSFPDLRSASPYVDNIRYRSGRILYPLLASPFRGGPALIWALFGINLLAIGAAAAAMAELADRVHCPPLVGVVCGLNPALIESLQGCLGDALAFALGLWGVVLWRRHIGWAVVLFSLAALTRETTLVVPIACLLASRRRKDWPLLIPFAVFAGWSLVVAAWIPPTTNPKAADFLSGVRTAVTWPGQAWLQLGFSDPGTITALALLTCGLVAAFILRDTLPEVAWWIVLEAIILVVSNAAVIERPFNAVRVMPIAVPALALAIFIARRGEMAHQGPAPRSNPLNTSRARSSARRQGGARSRPSAVSAV